MNHARALLNKQTTGLTPRNQIVRDAVNNVLTNIHRKNRTASNQRNETTPEKKFVTQPIQGRTFVYPSTYTQNPSRRFGKSFDGTGKGRYQEKNKNIMIRAENYKSSHSPKDHGVRLPPASMNQSSIKAKKNSTSRNKRKQLH